MQPESHHPHHGRLVIDARNRSVCFRVHGRYLVDATSSARAFRIANDGTVWTIDSPRIAFVIDGDQLRSVRTGLVTYLLTDAAADRDTIER